MALREGTEWDDSHQILYRTESQADLRKSVLDYHFSAVRVTVLAAEKDLNPRWFVKKFFISQDKL